MFTGAQKERTDTSNTVAASNFPESLIILFWVVRALYLLTGISKSTIAFKTCLESDSKKTIAYLNSSMGARQYLLCLCKDLFYFFLEKTPRACFSK